MKTVAKFFSFDFNWFTAADLRFYRLVPKNKQKYGINVEF